MQTLVLKHQNNFTMAGQYFNANAIAAPSKAKPHNSGSTSASLASSAAAESQTKAKW